MIVLRQEQFSLAVDRCNIPAEVIIIIYGHDTDWKLDG